ncbi:hypothetical protein, partial [Tateyamaria pelophila]|uniref:hypothetical protein n=1 Tax=Tateyamaria pelophila TaxID=328415 RepID=UPI001CC1975D
QYMNMADYQALKDNIMCSRIKRDKPSSANWQRSFLHRSKRAKPDKKGACAQFKALLSASATPCFSTESAESGPSLKLRN